MSHPGEPVNGLPFLGSHLMTCSRPPPPGQRCTICVCGFRKGKRTGVWDDHAAGRNKWRPV
jgi:hypothetical protein